MPADSLTHLELGPSPVTDKPDGAYRSPAFEPTEAGAAALRADPLMEAWDALSRRTGAAPFLRPQWTLAWWRAFACPGESLVLWHLWRNGRVVALLPLVQRRARLRSALNFHTPQSGLLAENAAAAQALLQALFHSGAREVVLAALDSTGPDPDLCERSALSHGYRALVLRHEAACSIPLDGTWAAYEKTLGRDVTRDVQRRRRRLQELGEYAIEVCDGAHELDSKLQLGFELEGSGWKRRNGTAIVSDPRVERFYLELAQWAANENLLRLCFLRVNGQALAMQYALEHRGTWYLLKCGYDEHFHRLSPGKVLLHELIRHCFERGMRNIELCGDVEEHKQRWNPRMRTLQRIHLYAPTVAGRLAWARAMLRPWLKRGYLRLNPPTGAASP